MAACFTPSGRGCCYHGNGVISVLITEEGGTISDEEGAVMRRWVWPEGGAKLKEPITYQVRQL